LSVQCSILVYCDINEKIHYRTHLDFGKVKRMTESKVCPNCKKLKPNTDYYGYDTGGNKYAYWCIECTERYIEHTSVGAN